MLSLQLSIQTQNGQADLHSSYKKARLSSFVDSIKLHDFNFDWDKSIYLHSRQIYYAYLLGLDRILHDLINTRQMERRVILTELFTPTLKASKIINAEGEKYGNAL